MPVIDEGLFSYISTHATMTALIGARVYPFIIPEGATLPCMTFQRISTSRYPSHDTSGTTNLSRPRFQFDAWATTYKGSKDITDALRSILNGRKGTTGNVTVQGALVVDETPTYEPETKLFRSRSDYFIWVID